MATPAGFLLTAIFHEIPPSPADELASIFLSCLGCWLAFWENNHRDNSHHPICFGVEDVSRDVREAFERSLKRVYSRNAIPFEENWLLGWIPAKDLNKLNAFEEISPKLRKIWNSMCDAAERENNSK